MGGATTAGDWGGGGAAVGERRPPGLAQAPAVRAYGVREEERRTDDLFFNQASEWSGPRMGRKRASATVERVGQLG